MMCSPLPLGSKPKCSSTSKSATSARKVARAWDGPQGEGKIKGKSGTHCLQKHHGLGCNTFAAAGKAKLFGGSGFNIHCRHLYVQILGDGGFHSVNMRRHFRRLSDNQQIGIDQLPASRLHLAISQAQQIATVGTFIANICVGKMSANITQSRSAQKSIG